MPVLTAYPLAISTKLFGKSFGVHFAAIENDNALYMRHVQGLSRLPWPWSTSNFESFPAFSHLWRIESIPSAYTELLVWFGSRILGPTIAFNFYAILGIATAGIATYFTCRGLSVKKWIACISAVLVQSLPVFRQMLLTGMAASWNATFPLATLGVLLHGSTRSWPHLKTFCYGSAVVVLAFFQNTVTFYYSFIIFVLWICTNFNEIFISFRKLQRRSQRLIIICSLLAILTIVVLLSNLLRLTTNEYGVPYSVYGVDEVLKDPYTIKGFITPDPFHLLFPMGRWEPEGYSQQYGGLVLLVLCICSFTFLRTRNRPINLLIFVSVVFFLMSLGRFSIGNTTIPSVREFLRFAMIGNRRFAIAGMLFQCFVVIFASLALDAFSRRGRRVVLRNSMVSLMAIVALLDLNPSSRLYVNTYAQKYAGVRTALNKSENNGLYIAAGTERPKNHFVFDSPIFSDEFGVLSNAALGSTGLFDFLTNQGVGFILAPLDNLGNPFMPGFIQNSIRMNLPLPKPLFSRAAPAVTLETSGDDGGSENKWDVQLLKLTPAEFHGRVKKQKLAQFVSSPILEVPYSDMDRRNVTTEWAMSPEMNFVFEPLDTSFERTGKEEIEFHMELVPPPSKNASVRIVVTSQEGSVPLLLDSTGKKIVVKSNLISSVHIKTLDPCPVAEDASAGNLIGRPICFGLKEFAVLER